MAPTLYMMPTSPVVRAVLITEKALGLQLVHKEINTAKGENRTPEFLKLNPQHTVPTLVEEDGFVLWDSHAINSYLVSKYGKTDSLYPKVLKKRAVVDQRMYFDSGVAFNAIGRVLKNMGPEGKTLTDQEKNIFNEIYGFLEAFLDCGKKYMAGDEITIADYSIYATLTTMDVVVPIDSQKFPRVAAWFKTISELPEAEANKEGLAAFASIVKKLIK